MEWILNNNEFLFQDKVFKQCKGTSMGASFAPEYACLFLGLWEEEFIHNPQKNVFFDNIKFYCRYIDDIYLHFSGNETELQSFHEFLNSTKENIRLNMEYSKTKIDFLDLTIYKGDEDSLHTTLFCKQTDRNSLLHYHSFHPPHQKKNIPYGQFQRVRRIFDSDPDFEKQTEDLSKRFRERSYRPHVITAALEKVRHVNCSNLLQKSHKRTRNPSSLFFVTRYGTKAQEIKRVINSNWSILKSDVNLRTIFPEPPVISYKRAPTIKDTLVRSYLPARREDMWLKKTLRYI